MKTICTICQKGGVGKSTTCLALAAGFHSDGKRVLILDVDPQCNITFVTGAMGARPDLHDVLTGAADPKEAIKAAPVGDILPSSALLSDADIKSPDDIKRLVGAFSRRYDVVIIDCPPSLGALTIAAVVAANYAVIPAKADSFGYTAALETMKTIQLIREKGNKVKLLGILPTLANPRANIHKQFVSALEDLAAANGCRVYDSIRTSTAIPEAESMQRPDFYQYAPKSGAVQDYKRFYEVIRREI